MLQWLPQKPNVRLLLSAVEPQPISDLLGTNCTVIHMAQLSISAIDQYLSSHQPTLTAVQQADLEANIRASPSLGYLNSGSLLARFWTKLTSTPRLGTRTQQNLVFFLAKLEDVLGETLVRRLVGYLCLQPSGILANELEDLYGTYRCSPAFLHYCLADLEPFLSPFYTMSGHLAIKWRHSIFLRAGTDRYLLQKDKASSYHSVAALYYLNEPDDMRIFCQFSEEGAGFPVLPDTVLKQPLIFGQIGTAIKVNLRKVEQLPRHLSGWGRPDLLKAVCLLRSRWLRSALSCEGGLDRLFELTGSLQLPDDETEWPLLSGALRLAAPVLALDSAAQTSGQLAGRLSDDVRLDRLNPPAEGVGRRYGGLEQLLCDMRAETVLVPGRNCMMPPTVTAPEVEAKMMPQSGSADEISCMGFSEARSELLVATYSGLLSRWSRSRLVGIVHGVRKDIFQIAVGGPDDSKVALASPDILEIWVCDLELPARILARLVVTRGPYRLTVVEDRSLLVAIFSGGPPCLSVWDIKDIQARPLHNHWLPAVVDTDANNLREILVAPVCCRGNLALLATRGDNKGHLVNVETGELGKVSLNCTETGSAIIDVCVSSSYLVLATRALAWGSLKMTMCYLELFDITSCLPVRRVTGCSLDNSGTGRLSCTDSGSHAITVHPDQSADCTELALWNLETGEHRHLEALSGSIRWGGCIARELSCVYVLGTTEVVRIGANTSTAAPIVSQQSPRQNYRLRQASDGYLEQWSEDNSQLRVLKVTATAGAKAMPHCRVLISHSDIAQPGDVVLVHNATSIVVLADRGPSSLASECKDVFQTLRVVDRNSGRVFSCLDHLVVYPARASEYLLLQPQTNSSTDEEVPGASLLGVSENRSHLVVWNLDSGQIRTRLRPQPELLPLEQVHSQHDLVIDTVLVSPDNDTLITAFYTAFLCLFRLQPVSTAHHAATLVTDRQRCSTQSSARSQNIALLRLQQAALGNRLLLQSYFNEAPTISVWSIDTVSCVGASVGPLASLTLNRPIRAVGLGADCDDFVVCVLQTSGPVCWRRPWRQLTYLPGFFPVSSAEDDYCTVTVLPSLLLISTGHSIHLWSHKDCQFTAITSLQPDRRIHSFVTCDLDRVLAFTLCGSQAVHTVSLETVAALGNDVDYNDDNDEYLT